MRKTDSASFVAFVETTSPQLLRSAYLLTHDWAAAEDLVQSALLKALSRWPRIERTEAPIGYVRKVLLSLFLSGRRRAWTAEQPYAELADLAPTAAEPDPDLRLSLVAALAQLPPGQRAVIVLRYFDDLTEAATAAALGCSVGTVKSQTARALARLRDHPSLRTISTLATDRR